MIVVPCVSLSTFFLSLYRNLLLTGGIQFRINDWAPHKHNWSGFVYGFLLISTLIHRHHNIHFLSLGLCPSTQCFPLILFDHFASIALLQCWDCAQFIYWFVWFVYLDKTTDPRGGICDDCLVKTRENRKKRNKIYFVNLTCSLWTNERGLWGQCKGGSVWLYVCFELANYKCRR